MIFKVPSNTGHSTALVQVQKPSVSSGGTALIPALWTNQEPPGAAAFEVDCLELVQCFPCQLSQAKASPVAHLPSLSTRVLCLSTETTEPALAFSRPSWELLLKEAPNQQQPWWLSQAHEEQPGLVREEGQQDSDEWGCWCSWLA